MNARFSVFYRGSPVVLTIKPDEFVELCEWDTHDEGGWREVSTYAFDGREVVRDVSRDSRDCDGRIHEDSRCVCPVARLRSHAFDGTLWPEWERVREGQRDYAAEAMGY